MSIAPLAAGMDGIFKSWSLRRVRVAAGLAFACLTLAACGSEAPLREAPGLQGPIDGPPPATGPLSAACDAARAQLRWEYEQVRHCTADSQCHYIDGFFSVLPREDRMQPVTSAVCGGITPLLMTANPQYLLTVVSQLRETALVQTQACTRPPDAFDADYPCERTTRIVPTLLPTCREGRCQLPLPL